MQGDQNELADLVRDKYLTKEKAKLLGSKLKEKNLLVPGTSLRGYSRKKKIFFFLFSTKGNLVFCCNIPELVEAFGI